MDLFGDNPTTAEIIIELLTIVTMTTAIVAGVVKFALRSIDKKIKEATRQIQPGTNGGSSLTDLHDKLDSLIEQNADEHDKLKTRLDVHQYRLIELNERIGGHRDWV